MNYFYQMLYVFHFDIIKQMIDNLAFHSQNLNIQYNNFCVGSKGDLFLNNK